MDTYFQNYLVFQSVIKSTSKNVALKLDCFHALLFVMPYLNPGIRLVPSPCLEFYSQISELENFENKLKNQPRKKETTFAK